MTDTPIRLYELVLEHGRSSSPFVWRIRYALAHKGLPFESKGLGFTEIPSVFAGRFKTVPILSHGEVAMAESWDIAEYLDRAFQGSPALFSSAAELATVRLSEEWFNAVIQRKLFAIYALDIHDAARPADREYFRHSREQRLKGIRLEDYTAHREQTRLAVREALAPLRTQLKRFPFLGGSSPNYADYIVLGAFQWVASVSTLPLLAADDSLRDWLDRGFDLYGGIGRESGMRSLFENSST